MFTDKRSHFSDEAEDSLFRWRDMQCPAVFAESLAEEREPVPDIRYLGFLFGEPETTYGKELLDCRDDRVHKNAL